MPIELLFVLAAVGLFFLGRGGVKLPQLRKSPSVAGATATPAGGATPAPPAPPTPSSKSQWKLTASSLLTGYAAILGVMTLMLILVPVAWLSAVADPYQTVALTMILVGGFLYALNSEQRLWVVVMMVAFGILAFNKPEATAARVENAKSNGVTAIFKPAPPKPPTPAQLEANRKAAAEQRAIAAEAERQRLINEAVAKAAAEAEAAKYRPLTTAAFTTRTAGKFEPLQIKSGTQVGPINLYAACNTRWTKTGMGMIRILTRPDFGSEPVEATLTDHGYGVKQTGHAGKPAQLFFEAVGGDIQIELVRSDNGTNKANPC